MIGAILRGVEDWRGWSWPRRSFPSFLLSFSLYVFLCLETGSGLVCLGLDTGTGTGTGTVRVRERSRRLWFLEIHSALPSSERACRCGRGRGRAKCKGKCGQYQATAASSCMQTDGRTKFSDSRPSESPGACVDGGEGGIGGVFMIAGACWRGRAEIHAEDQFRALSRTCI